MRQFKFILLNEGLLLLSIAELYLYRGSNNVRLIFLNHPQLFGPVIYLESTKEVIQFFEKGPKHFKDLFKKNLHPVRLDHLLSWLFVVFYFLSHSDVSVNVYENAAAMDSFVQILEKYPAQIKCAKGNSKNSKNHCQSIHPEAKS